MSDYESEIVIIIPTENESRIGTEMSIISELYETEGRVHFCRSFGKKPPSAIGVFKDYVEQRDDYARGRRYLTIKKIGAIIPTTENLFNARYEKKN